jgi:hypothetical protein
MSALLTLGLAFIAALALTTVAAAAASAAPEWLDNGFPISSRVTVTQKGILLVTDLRAGIAVECTVTGSGSVGPGAEGEQGAITAVACTTVKGSCSSPHAEWLEVPWSTRLGEFGGKVKNQIVVKSAWRIKCNGINTDTCAYTASALSVLMTKLSAVVDEELPVASNENTGKCTLFGGTEGDVSGALTIEGLLGNAISIS